jgi:hypothetical protein
MKACATPACYVDNTQNTPVAPRLHLLRRAVAYNQALSRITYCISNLLLAFPAPNALSAIKMQH